MSDLGKAILAGSGVAIVAAAVIGGLIVLGSPGKERMRRLDERRVDDLRAVARGMDVYWTRHGSLPASLEELSREPGVYAQLLDPETGRAYECRILSGNTYGLCAHFSHDTAEGQDKAFWYEGFWSHGAGRHCFQLAAREVER